MLLFAGYFYPLVTFLALVGCFIINLRTFTNSTAFFYERLEGSGMLLIGIFPYVLPLGIRDPMAFLPAFLFIMAIDSFHKIAHRETKHTILMWSSGIAFVLIAMVLYAHSLSDILVLTLVALLPLIGLKIVEKKAKKYSWAYYQTWQAILVFTLFAKYPSFLYDNFYR
jgi:hypothetical protein